MFTTIRSPPSLDEFVPLEEHQSHTPDTFFGGRIILHYHAVNAKAWIPDSSDGAPGLPIFPVDRTAPTDPEWSALGENGEVIEQEVELFVNSECGTFRLSLGLVQELTVRQESDHFQPQGRVRSPDPLSINLDPCDKEHWSRGEQGTGCLDANRASRGRRRC